MAEKNRLVTEYLRMRQKVGELESFKTESARLLDLLGKLKALFSEIQDLAYICDAEGGVLYANEAFEGLTGRGLDEFLGKPFHPLFDEENLERALECYKRTLNGERTECELRFRDTGTLCAFRSAPLRDASGRVSGIVGIAREIPRSKEEDRRLESDRRLLGGLVEERTLDLITANEELLREVSLREEAEKRTEAHEKRLLSLLEAMPDAVIMADGQGTITHANGRAAVVTGVPVEELCGMRLSALGLPRRFHGAPTRGFRKAVIRCRGGARRVLVSSTEVDAGGEKAVNIVIREAARPVEGAVLQQAMELSRGSVVLADINGSIEFANPGFEKLTGYSAAQAAGENIRSFFAARNEREADEFWLTVLEGTPWRGVLRTMRKDGASGSCETLVTPVRSGQSGRITHLLSLHEENPVRPGPNGRTLK